MWKEKDDLERDNDMRRSHCELLGVSNLLCGTLVFRFELSLYVGGRLVVRLLACVFVCVCMCEFANVCLQMFVCKCLFARLCFVCLFVIIRSKIGQRLQEGGHLSYFICQAIKLPQEQAEEASWHAHQCTRRSRW